MPASKWPDYDSVSTGPHTKRGLSYHRVVLAATAPNGKQISASANGPTRYVAAVKAYAVLKAKARKNTN